MKRKILFLLVVSLFTFGATEALASQSCPTGDFDIYSHNDPGKDFIGPYNLAFWLDKNGNCAGAIGWRIVGTSTEIEERLNEFSYLGDGWFKAWHTGNPGNIYTILIREDPGHVQVFWGNNLSGHARRTSQPLRKIRIINKEGRPVTDVAIALEWQGVLWDWDHVDDFTGTSYFGQTGFASALYGNGNFLYRKSSHQPGENQIIINKVDHRAYTGNVLVDIWFKIDGVDHFDWEVLQNWSDSNSPQYIHFLLDTAGANAYWNEIDQRWEGNFLRPAPMGTPCPAPNPTEVVIYQHANLQGHCRILEVGEYPHSDFFKPVGNDAISSLDVGTAVSVTLYQHGLYEGRQQTFLGGQPYLSLSPFDFNDRTSSMKVQQIR